MIEWLTLYDWQTDWNKPKQEAIDKRRRLFDRSPYLVRSQFVTAVNQVREGHRRLVRDYGFGYADQLAHDSSVDSTPHLDRLLEIAQRRLSSVYVHDPVWFEAISLFDQAVSLTLIEQREPMERIGTTIAQLIDLLSVELFIDGFDKIDFYAYHDPKQDMIVPAQNVGFNHQLKRPGMNRRKVSLNCRRIQNNGITYLHHRLKDPFRAWLKMQRQIKQGLREDPFDVSDRCGLMFVVPSVCDVAYLAKQVLHLLTQHGAVITYPLHANYDVDAPVDAYNVDSSKLHKFASASVYWNDEEIELQFLTFAHYFSSLRALSEVNHELYKLNQTMRYFFPLLWPKEHYGVDWKNPQVCGKLNAWKIAQLGWAVKETK